MSTTKLEREKGMKATEVILGRGHENITSTNRTTFEITKETHLTRQGDCIIAVGSSKGADGLSDRFKKLAQKESAKITITFQVDDEVEVVNARGSPHLSLTHATDLVVRKSDYVCSRTLAIKADKAAKDFSRTLVEKLRNPKQRVEITLTAESAT